MSERTLLGMSDAEFDALIERYIERGLQDAGDLETDLFFDALSDFAAPIEAAIAPLGEWYKGHLTLRPEKPVPPEVVVQDNRIVAPGFTFVIRIKQPTPPSKPAKR
ncbi:MAG: hypothetical protein E3J21_23765 [Anaerolineales bacterium]|nr:MAG: hypothetical protein E3J21_23765 [Anaerolineales bacterium]